MNLRGSLRREIQKRQEISRQKKADYEKIKQAEREKIRKIKEEERMRAVRMRARKDAEREMTPKSERFGKAVKKGADWFFNPPQNSRQSRPPANKKKQRKKPMSVWDMW